MKMKNLLKAIFAFALIYPNVSFSQTDYDVIENGGSTMYYDLLMHKFDSLVDIRLNAMDEALTSEAKQLERRDSLRVIFKELIGRKPERTDLNPVVVDTIERDDIGFKIEKLYFESLPNHHVTANFYIPLPDTGNFPGVLVMPGHYGAGKAADVLQSLCMLLAENNIAALILDPMGQAERGQVQNPTTGALLYSGNSGTTTQSIMNVGSMIVGRSAAAWELWDNQRALDYLYSRTEVVDTSKIGATGSFGGGAQLLNLISVDYDRIDAAVITSWATNKSYIFNDEDNDNGAGPHHLAYQGPNTIDQTEQMLMFAPKPIMICAGSQDFIDTAGTHETRDEVEAIYESLGVADQSGYFESDDAHGYTSPKREAAVQWFKTWLMGDASSVEDPENSVLTEAQLEVTSTGQVTTSFENEKTITDINTELADSFATVRTAFWSDNTSDSCISKVKELLHYKENTNTPSYTFELVEDRGTYSVYKTLVSYAGEMPIPVLYLKPNDISGKLKAAIILNASGKEVYAESGEYFEKNYLDSGKIVVSIDLRGRGETLDTRSNSKYKSDDHSLAIVTQYIGESMIGQRVQEVFKVIEVLENTGEVDTDDLSVLAIGRVGPVALHAAAFDERITEVKLLDTYSSWTPIVSDASLTNMMSYVVPFAMEYYDLTDLESAVAPRKVEYIESFESRLKKIKLNNGSLSPDFSKNTLEYDVVDLEPSDTAIIVTGTALNSDATISGNDTIDLISTTQDINLICTAADGFTKSTYTLHFPTKQSVNSKEYSTNSSVQQNYPNPFTTNTAIEYNLNELSKVNLTVYDATGKSIKVLVDKTQAEGKYTVEFDGSSLPAGLYYYQLKTGESMVCKKMVKVE